MTRIMVLGDTHGYKGSYLNALEFCNEHKIKHVFQMGDCGLFPAFVTTQDHIDGVNRVSRANNINNYWVRGNHDDTGAWQATIDYWPAPHHGFGMLRSNIRLLPRVSYFKMFGLNFLGVGGAISIDRKARLNDERSMGPRTLYWPDESISDEDLTKVKHGKKVDIFMSHDCSDHTPFRDRLKPDFESEQNRRKIDIVLKRSQPDFHFHGHMHTKYEWENYLIHQGQHSTATYGLEANREAMWTGIANDNWLTFDVETKEIRWKSQYLQDEKIAEGK